MVSGRPRLGPGHGPGGLPRKSLKNPLLRGLNNFIIKAKSTREKVSGVVLCVINVLCSFRTNKVRYNAKMEGSNWEKWAF